jgi:putative hemolysin
MEWFAYAVWPAVWFFETSVSAIMRWGERRWKKGRREGPSEEPTLQELRAIAALARTSRLIGVREERIIVSAARLSTTPVREIMLPARYISMLHADGTLADALIAAHQEMHTRFPVATEPGNPQTIIGYANFKDIVACLHVSPREPSVRAVVRPLPSLDANASVANCLERLIREHAHIAIVRDGRGADGDVVGMITMEDILEELVGEIHDEYDRLPAHVSPVGRGWIVVGNVTLAQLREATGIPADGEPLPLSLSDWITHRLGRPPHGGDRLDVVGHEILVRKVRRHLVQEAQLMPAAEPPASSGSP